MTPVPTPARVDRRKALAHLRRSDPVLAAVIDRDRGFDPRAWLVDLGPMDAFGALTFQVLGQQLSVAATRTILRRLEDRVGDGRLPSPAAVLAAEPGALRSAGMSNRKAETLTAIATEFVEGRLSDALLRRLSDEEIETLLTAISGVGSWTVHGFLLIALDRPDVVTPGDLVLRKAVERVYGLDHRPSPAEVLEIAEPWRPYRSLATAYLFHAARDSAPPDGGAGATPPSARRQSGAGR